MVDRGSNSSKLVAPGLEPAATKMTSCHLLSLTCLLVSALSVQQKPIANPTSSSPFTASFDKLVSQNLDRWHTPGLAVAVINGQDTFSKV